MLAILISRMNSLFTKNIVYKMTRARYRPIFQNISRILLSLGMHICVSFSTDGNSVACFGMLRDLKN